VKDAMNAGKPCPWRCAKPRLGRQGAAVRAHPAAPSDAQLARLLQSAHVVDGIVKGLKAADWPQDGWQALSRLALQLCRLGREAAARRLAGLA
jgi:DNA polymerase-3 subunit delta